MSANNSSDNLASVLEQAQQARAARDQVRAHELYIRATQLDPNNAAAWAGRAALSPEPDDAIAAWGYVLALAPQSPDAHSQLTQRVQERVSKSKAGDELNLIALGRELAKVGQRASALLLFARATELAPNDAEDWVWRAGASDSPQDAVACLNRALAIDPENKRAQAGLRWVLAEKIAPPQFASPAMARQAASQIAEGRRLVEQGNKSRAHDYFVRASELDHSNEAAWLWRASTTGDVDEALMSVEQALALNPKNATTQDARKFLRERKLGKEREPRAAASEPVAPIQLPIESPAPNQRARVLFVAIAIILIVLLFYTVLQRNGYIP